MNNEESVMNILNSPINFSETGVEGYVTEAIPFENQLVDETDAVATMLAASIKEQNEEDTTVYDTTLPHILFDRSAFLSVLNQIAPILDAGGKRAVFKGITIKVREDSKIDLIMPNDFYYFKSTIDTESSTIPEGTLIFLEYSFIQKLVSFLPKKVCISLDNSSNYNKYYLQFTTGKMELMNNQLLDSDAKLLELPYNITEKICDVQFTDLANSLIPMSKVINFESDSPKKLIKVADSNMFFKSALVYAVAKSSLPNITFRTKEVSYLVKAISLSKTPVLEVYDTDSNPLKRFALKYGDTILVTNYSIPDTDQVLMQLYNETPSLTKINYEKLKKQLSFVSSYIYAMGTITLVNDGSNLIGKVKLQNSDETPIEIPVIPDDSGLLNITLPVNVPIRVNVKTLLKSIDSLDPNLELYLGYSDKGVLYLTNSAITIMMIII